MIKTMPLEVSTVTGPQDLQQFLKLPWQIYQGDPHWVPPILAQQRQLLGGSHPFHRHAEMELFLARRDGRAVGRIAAIVNHQHNRVHGDATGFFGFFESIDDAGVAWDLLDAAARWLAERGLRCLRGPASPSTNEECGTLVEGFGQRPVFMMPYNPDYYPALLEKCGLRKAKDLCSFYVDRSTADQELAERMGKVVERATARSGIVLRRPDIRRFGDDLAIIQRIYNQAWETNWGFVPMTGEEFLHLGAQLKELIVPRFARIAMIGGEPAGFGFLLPDYNAAIRRIDGRLWPFGVPYIAACYHLQRLQGLRMMALGVTRQHQKRGLEAAIMYDLYQEILRSHYQWCDMGWTLEDNHAINNAIRAWGARPYKRYRIYERAI